MKHADLRFYCKSRLPEPEFYDYRQYWIAVPRGGSPMLVTPKEIESMKLKPWTIERIVFEKVKTVSEFVKGKTVFGWKNYKYGWTFVWDEKPKSVKMKELISLLGEFEENEMFINALTICSIDAEENANITQIESLKHHLSIMIEHGVFDEP